MRLKKVNITPITVKILFFLLMPKTVKITNNMPVIIGMIPIFLFDSSFILLGVFPFLVSVSIFFVFSFLFTVFSRIGSIGN